jgi:hypothetical protein
MRDLTFNVTLNQYSFYDYNPPFIQIGQSLTYSPYGNVPLNEGDTIRLTFNFTDDQAVQVTNNASITNETVEVFLGAGQLANPGTGSTQVDLTYDYTVSFLGYSGDLLLPSISRPGARTIGGSLGPQVNENLTDTSFLFQGLQFEFANIHDNNAAAGVTEPNRILPRNFDVTGFRIRAGGVDLAQIVDIPEPSSLALMTFGLFGLGGVTKRRSRRA